MHAISSATRLDRKLIDSLYLDAMLLADEARAYFDRKGGADRDQLEMMMRVSFSCEALRVTTRLMHVIAWLLSRRAVFRGEIGEAALAEEKYRLGEAAKSDPDLVAQFPFATRILIGASEDLYRRVAMIDRAQDVEVAPDSPVRSMLDRIEQAF